MTPLPSFGPIKQKEYVEVEAEIKQRLNPSFTRLIGSQMSNSTTVTDYSPHTSTMNLIKSKNSSESNVWYQGLKDASKEFRNEAAEHSPRKTETYEHA